MIGGWHRIAVQAGKTLRRQHQEIVRLQAEKSACELAYMRIGRDLIEQFLVALEKPENNDRYRERLTTSLGFYRDEIAVREEHVR